MEIFLIKRGILNKAALILFLLADFIFCAKVRSILADRAFTLITSLAMGASAGNLCKSTLDIS